MGALAGRPQDLAGYVRHLPLWGRQPMDCEVPWISFPALRYLEQFIRPHHAVFEYGGGGSTLWFARRARSVLTMESEADWHGRLAQTLEDRGLKNATCEFHALSGDSPDRFGKDAFFRRIESETWDVVLVDCYLGFSAERYGLTRPFALELALQHTNPGGIVVLDDSWMFKELLEPRPGWHIENFVGTGPCRYGVTSTAIFEKL
jgi:hypothetical protein